MTPAQVNTFMWAVAATAVYVAMLLAIEAWKGRDQYPDNLITHAMRAAVKRIPWLFIIVAILFGFFAGHCFGQ